MWGFDLIIHPQVGEFDFPLDQIPTISPPSPYWGWGWGLIGKLWFLAVMQNPLLWSVSSAQYNVSYVIYQNDRPTCNMVSHWYIIVTVYIHSVF